MQAKSSLSTINYRVHAVSIALIILSIITLFWRVFFLGETLIDVSTLSNQLPWGYDAPPIDYSYNRGDLTDTYVTREYFVVQAYNDGETPLWNPYTMSGHPIYADGVTRTLSPFLLFYKFLDVPLGYSIARICELFLAAVLMYVFLIGIGVGARGGLFGSLVFMLSGHSLLHLTGLGWWGGLMWLPLIILFVDRAVARFSYKYAVWAGLCLALQLFCGYMPNQVYYIGAVIVYYVVWAFSQKRVGWSPAARRRPATPIHAMVMLLVTVVIGLALSLTQWVPVAELLQYSNRRIVPTDQGYIYLPPWYLATLVFPNLFGTARDAEMLKLFTAINVSHDHSLYLSIIALVMVCFSIYWLRISRKKASELSRTTDPSTSSGARISIFLLLAGVALFIMTAAPLYVHVTKFIPVAQTIRVIVRAGVLFTFAGAALAGIGVDLLLKSDQSLTKRFTRFVWRFSAVVAGIAFICSIAAYSMRAAGVFEGYVGERPVGSGLMDFIRRAAAALSDQFMPPSADILVPIGVLLICSCLLAIFSGTVKSFRPIGNSGTLFVALVILLGVDLFWNSRQYNPTFNRYNVFPRTQTTDLLRSLPRGRVLVTPSGLESNRRVQPGEQKIIAPPNTLLPYEIYSVTGKDQLFPKHYREFCSLIEPQNNLSHVVFDESHSRYFDLLNVRYVLTHSANALSEYKVVSSEEGLTIYENEKALPRLFFAERAISADPSAVLGLLRDPGFDLRTNVVIEEPGGVDGATVHGDDNSARADLPLTSQRQTGTAKLEHDKRNLVVASTDNEIDAFLVFTDNYYPGWTATIDGEPVTLFRANHTMRAIKVPAGRHMVVFEFDPRTFWFSGQMSIAVLILVAAALVFMEMRSRRAA
jgi:hypothetical protein